MTREQLNALIVQSLLRPREAAGVLIGLGLPREALWPALALMSVLNGIVYSLTLRLAPQGDQAAMAMPPTLHSPILFTLFLFGSLALTVLALHRVGRALGGHAEIEHILVLICWLQVLRLILQVALVVTILLAPMLSALLILAASLWGIYILLGFVDTAHGFGNLFKAAAAIFLALVAMAVGLTLLFGLFGISFMGGA